MQSYFLGNVVVAEGLNPYQAIQWTNHKGQQDDLDIFNNCLLQSAYTEDKDSAINFIESDKEKCSVFWKTQLASSKQQN